MRKTSTTLCLFLSGMLVSTNAMAHFPWLLSDPDGHVSLHFGESLDDRTYAMPKPVAEAEIHASTDKSLAMTAIETDQFVGLRSDVKMEEPTTVHSTIRYGNYHGTELIYSVQHSVGALAKEASSVDATPDENTGARVPLHSIVVDTPTGVTCTIHYDGKPLAGAEVKLFCSEGHEEASAVTDEAGQVRFSDQEVEPGINAIMVGHKVDAPDGASDQATTSQTHYLTATFYDPEDAAAASTEISMRPSVDDKSSMPTPVGSVTVDDASYPSVPEEVTSFGAAICDGALYMYGGHTGAAHHYDNESQGSTLWQLPLDGSSQWQAVATGPRVQGLAMVSVGGKLYRIGGFTAKNESGDEHDLWSQSNVASFDPSTKQWTELPPLPEPRSSFDAAVLDGKIYVIGGWMMAGNADEQWHTTAYRMDPSATEPTWEPLAPPPFSRRALSIAAHNGKMYVMGGMASKGGPSRGVDIYDVDTKSWTQGPELLGEAMDGFGSSSFATGGRLYATTYSGLLQRLSEDGSAWELVAELPTDRFFHRMLPINETKLVTLGGASMSSGKFGAIEVITVH